jgi:hypothetical protein
MEINGLIPRRNQYPASTGFKKRDHSTQGQHSPQNNPKQSRNPTPINLDQARRHHEEIHQGKLYREAQDPKANAATHAYLALEREAHKTEISQLMGIDVFA